MNGNNSGSWSISRDEWQVIGFILSVKIILLWSVWIGYVIHTNKWIRSGSGLLGIVQHWDAGQYKHIALWGYGYAGDARVRLVFFPLYPWLIRALMHAIPNPAVCGVIISNLASLFLGVLLWRLVAIDYDSETAFSAVWFLFIFPTSYFLDVPYTESLFLALVVGAFLACRRENWPLAGALGGLATLTHDTGLFLVAALGAEAFVRYRQTRKIDLRWSWLALIPAGFAIFLLLNWSAAGNPFAFMKMEGVNWGNHVRYPWSSYDQLGVVNWMSPKDAMTMGVQVFAFVAIALAFTVAAVFELRASYWIWMALNWIVIACQSWDISAPRLVLAMFPMFIIAALWGRNRLVFAAMSTWSILLLGLFASEFVLGHWAF